MHKCVSSLRIGGCLQSALGWTAYLTQALPSYREITGRGLGLS